MSDAAKKPPNPHIQKRVEEVKGIGKLIKSALFDPNFWDHASERDDEVVLGTRAATCATCEDKGLVGAAGAQVPCPLRCQASDRFHDEKG